MIRFIICAAVLVMSALMYISYVCLFDVPEMITEGLRIPVLISENSDAEITHADMSITFQGMNQDYRDDLQGYLALNNTVRQDYTIVNQTDHEIETRLFYAAGIPEYAPENPDEEKHVQPADLQKYHFIVNGSEITPRLRLFRGKTPVFYPEMPEPDDLTMADGITSGFFTPDLPVYEYVYHPEEISAQNLTACLLPDSVNFQYKYYCGNQLIGWNYVTNSQDEVLFPVSGEMTVRVYCFGGDPGLVPEWEILDENGNTTPGRMALSEINESDLTSFLENHYPAMKDIPVSDRMYHLSKITSGRQWLIDSDFIPDRVHGVLWLEYTLKLSPQETVHVSLDTPVYPDIYISDSVPAFQFRCYPVRHLPGSPVPGTLSINTDMNLISRSTLLNEIYHAEDHGFSTQFSDLGMYSLQFMLSSRKGFYERVSKDLMQSIYSYLQIIVWFAVMILCAFFLLRGRKRKAVRNLFRYHFPFFLFLTLGTAWTVDMDGYRTFFPVNCLFALYGIYLIWNDPGHSEFYLIYLLLLHLYTVVDNLMVMPGYPGKYSVIKYSLFHVFFKLYPEGCRAYVPSSIYGILMPLLWGILMIRRAGIFLRSAESDGFGFHENEPLG